MYPGIFYKLISSLLLISILNLTCIETVYAIQRETVDPDAEDASDRAHLLRQRPLPVDDSSHIASVSAPVSPKPTLLDVVTDDEEATRELRDYVASLPADVRSELRTFADLQEYVHQLGPRGTKIKWTFSFLNGLAQTAGVCLLFEGAPAIGGLLNSMSSGPNAPPPPALIGYSALAGVFTLPDTVLGTENTMLAVRHAFQDQRLLKYMKKKGATHVVIRGTADGIGTTVFVTMTIKAFIDAVAGAPLGLDALFIIFGIELGIHQATQSAQIVDERVVKKMRYVRDQMAPAEVRMARKELDRRVMSAFRMSIMERDYAHEKMEELRGLRAYMETAVAELAAMRDEFASPGAYLAAKHTLQEFEVLAELDAVLRNFNPDHKYEPPPHKTRWWESIPVVGPLIGPYSKTYKAVYGLFGLFAAVGSYITEYGYAWIIGGGGFGAATGTAFGLATPITVLFTLFFMDQLGQSVANVVSSALGHNTAMDVNRIDQTHVGSQSMTGRVGRTILDFVGLGMAGFKTLFKTGSAAVGAGNLLGNTPADHTTQMPGIVALAASNGAADHLNTGTRLQQALSRIVEYKHGAGAQALTDYIARLRGAFADMNNEDVPELVAAIDGLHDLSERLIGEYERRRREAGVAASADQRPMPPSEASGEVREPSPSGHDTVLPAALRTGEGAAAEASHRTTPPPLQPAQQAGGQRRGRQQESAGVEMSVIRQLREPLMQAEHRRAPVPPGQGMESRMTTSVRRMVSAVWSKVTLTRAPVVAPVLDV